MEGEKRISVNKEGREGEERKEGWSVRKGRDEPRAPKRKNKKMQG